MIVTGGKIYDRCGVCQKLVRLNKPLFGDWHFCELDERPVKSPAVVFRESKVRSGGYNPPPVDYGCMYQAIRENQKKAAAAKGGR